MSIEGTMNLYKHIDAIEKKSNSSSEKGIS